MDSGQTKSPFRGVKAAMRYVLLGALLILSACATPEERAKQGAAQQAQMRADDQQRCVTYGFQPGSDGFAGCMMQIDQRRRAIGQALMFQMLGPK